MVVSPELFRVHFAKPFVTLDIRIVLTAHLVKFLLQFIVTVSIRVVLARTNEIKGRLGNKNIAISDEGLHVSVEERQEQRPDVGPIDISIGHDDDLAVTDFTEIEFIANPAAKGRDHGADFIVVQHLVQAGLLHVEDFAAQGQDGLEGRSRPCLALPPAESLRRCRFPFLPHSYWNSPPVSPAGSLLPARSCAVSDHGPCGQPLGHGLREWPFLQFSRRRCIFLKVLIEGIAHHIVNDSADFAVAKLGLCLPFKLRFPDFQAEDTGQAFADVITGKVFLAVL